MADTTLERIDATLNQSCACGCGRQLDPDGPSAWWATEGCFKVGTRALTGADHPEIIGRSLRTTSALAELSNVRVTAEGLVMALAGIPDIDAWTVAGARLRMFRYKADHRCFEKYWDESTRRTITVEIGEPETVVGQRGDGADTAKTPANVQESGGARRERATAQPPDLTAQPD